MSQAIRAVVVAEDNPGDARLLSEMFTEGSAQNTLITHVESMSELETHLSGSPLDIILLDPGLPDTQGLDSVRRARAAAPDAALVVLTSLDDEKVALQALQEGAQDYLVKGQIDARGLLRALRYSVERKSMEAAAASMAVQMTHLAEHDFLTGLPNRMLFNDRVGQAISIAPPSRQQGRCAVSGSRRLQAHQ
jgi:PleD family two-component response regulator